MSNAEASELLDAAATALGEAEMALRPMVNPDQSGNLKQRAQEKWRKAPAGEAPQNNKTRAPVKA